MSAILEAAQEEETRLTTEFEDAKNQYEVRVRAVRNLIVSYGGTDPTDQRDAETLPPETKKPSGLPPRKAKSKAKPTQPRSRHQGTRNERKAKILECLSRDDREKVPSATIRLYIGVKSKATVRELLQELIDEGKVIKTGERAGTRYGITSSDLITAGRNEPCEIPESFDPPPERPRVSMPNGTMESKVVDYLSSQSHAQSPSMIGLKTGLGVQDVVGALNRLADQGRVHKRRIGSGDAYEAVVKGERL